MNPSTLTTDKMFPIRIRKVSNGFMAIIREGGYDEIYVASDFESLLATLKDIYANYCQADGGVK